MTDFSAFAALATIAATNQAAWDALIMAWDKVMQAYRADCRLAPARNLGQALALVATQRQIETAAQAGMAAQAAAPTRRRLSPKYGWRPMIARRDSNPNQASTRCAGCKQAIRRGDSIVWNGDQYRAWHDACSPDEAWNWTAVSATGPAPAPTTPAVEPASELAVEAPIEINAMLSDAVQTGRDMAARAGLVRGGVLPADVNPSQGYNSRSIVAGGAGLAEGEAARYTDGRQVDGRLQLTREQSLVRQRLNQSIADRRKAEAEQPLISREALARSIRESADGALFGWRGEGELTRAQIGQALAAAGWDLRWRPRPRSGHAVAGRLVQQEFSGGEVEALTDTASIRGSLLELDDSPRAPSPDSDSFARRWAERGSR